MSSFTSKSLSNSLHNNNSFLNSKVAFIFNCVCVMTQIKLG